MTWTERTRYQASWGAWYVQIQFDTGEVVELKFNHEPTQAEIQPLAETVWADMQEPEPAIILKAEDETEV